MSIIALKYNYKECNKVKMGDLFKTLATNIESGILSAGLIFSVFFIYTFRKKVPQWVASLFKIDVRSESDKILSLRNHDIFSTCIRVKKQVELMKFYTGGEYDATKTRMCGDFARHKVKVCGNRIYALLDNDLSSYTADALKKLILSEQSKMHEEYVALIKSDWLSKGIIQEDVDYVVELFEKFRYDVIVSFEHRINSIFGSTYHKNNFERLLAVFEMWSMGIDLLPKDMLTTFETLNGKFKEINFK